VPSKRRKKTLGQLG
jgi:hypothetical protein